MERAESAPPVLQRLTKRRGSTWGDANPVTRRRTMFSWVSSYISPREPYLMRKMSSANDGKAHLLGRNGETEGGASAHAAQDGEGEPWPAFLLRAASLLQAEGVAEEPAVLFETFRCAEDVGVIFATFARLFHLATLPQPAAQGSGRRGSECGPTGAAEAPWAGPMEVPGRRWRFPYEPIRVLLAGNWKAKKLWKLLDDKVARQEYAEAPGQLGPLSGRRAVVVGAGPCGLRAAIELRLLGVRTTVVERRVSFSRINQLHIWDWCGEDLKALGARVLEPPPLDFGANPDLLHVGIADLQKLLLKAALLLGAEVLLGVDFLGADWDSPEGGWRARLGGPPSTAGTGPQTEGPTGPLPPSPTAPSGLGGVAVLLGANGFGSAVGEAVGMRVEETQSLRPESAVGVICNFARSHGSAERKLRSYSMAKQFYLPLFARASSETGADLENIVYTKSRQSHYFVMTPSHKSLVDAGVVIDRTRRPMLARDNLDVSRLDAFVRRVAAFQFKADEQPVLLAAEEDLGGRRVPYADSGPRLFDFSRTRRQAEALRFVPPPPGSRRTGGEDDHLLVAVVGDALIEPFWPEGLGIVRGFFSVLDACSAVAGWAGGTERAQVQQQSDNSFTQLKTLSAATRKSVLREAEAHFSLAPTSRYRQYGTEGGRSPARCKARVGS